MFGYKPFASPPFATVQELILVGRAWRNVCSELPAWSDQTKAVSGFTTQPNQVSAWSDITSTKLPVRDCIRR